MNLRLAIPEDALTAEEWADLEKAVPPHHSQHEARTQRGRFAAATAARLTPRDVRGRFRQRLLRSECRAAADQVGETIRDQYGPRMQAHLQDLEAGNLPFREALRRAARDVALFYEQVYRSGLAAVGMPGVALTPADRAAVNRLVSDECDYLKTFLEDVAAGRGRMAYVERMTLYQDAAYEAFWMGWINGDQRAGRRIRWRYGNTIEHCRSCAYFVSMGWQPVKEFRRRVLARGFLPRSGMLECHGFRCQCWLEEMLAGVVQPRIEV